MKLTPKKLPTDPKLHSRNRHHGRYDIDRLMKVNLKLKQYVIKNPAGQKTIDFSNPDAVLNLNQALLAQYYDIAFWEIPKGYLCPPIPGRADYIHYAADLLEKVSNKSASNSEVIRVLDVGTGANLIYPLLGSREYGWTFVGTDIDPASVNSAKKIIQKNEGLSSMIEVRLQSLPEHIFKGCITSKDTFQLSMCNPPFHKSLAEANIGTKRKIANLHRKKTELNKKVKDVAPLNFGGQNSELWCPGGELAFIKQMIHESVEVKEQIIWFTCLVSKKENLPIFKKELAKKNVEQFQIVNMAQGQKVSRFIAWTFKKEIKLR